MFEKFLNLTGVSVLNKEQQQTLFGGSGTCGYRVGTFTFCGVDQQFAQEGAAENGGYWCCDSCGSASWTVIG